ncbi:MULTISPECIES: type II toxin-antitoxin system RelE/ParE family toxin [unclassified Oceanobacter]|uniref:type II toxin-antitoxin system RelE/ParE family toxin n=1 Tax=unclassified Oceanobacter TaxID=2620260 RepID=UPI0026E199E1|nr:MULTISPECIES: type II toxin-antitoxin system RelE/ParE family toxin [unclassified Oceanobacter]MDO6683009.1 type II toxin-antitoxin system RelE/ParE family toxin [Oceanobacter sp. 5_MG-2023]MDP2548133.1 type II toxin-antitoxin system RelE/ParE family toxin [Oceanobacter sp. 4_MG-2023]
MIYKTKGFVSSTKKESLSDDDLVLACREMTNGLYDADLGGNVYKKRISVGNKGKSGGYRTIVGAVMGDRYFFLYAFAKNARSNINTKEKLALKELAKEFLNFTPGELDQLVQDGELIIVGNQNE